MKFHPLAEILPLLEGDAFEEFVADIAEHGLLNPIMLFESKVLDGRNRARACETAGIEPRYVEFTGDSRAAAAYVLSQNVHRRHLDPSMRAMVAARMANLKWGQRADTAPEGQICLSDAAKVVGVSERSVKSAKVVIEHGTPELQQAVTSGRLAVHEAEKTARLPVEAQRQFLEAAAGGTTFHVWANNYDRKERAAELGTTTKALPVGKRRWPIILADPPWDYKNFAAGRARSHPSHHYPVMQIDEICALPIADLAADDCVLFLWTTAPQLAETIEMVLKAWGFTYKSGLVWDKEVAGLGFWARGQHEHLLIATRGNPPLPPQEATPRSVIRERRREHSRKPEARYAIIESMYPELPKLELFARHARPGWDCWGNEVAPTETNGDGLDIPECLRRRAP
jgi:N6-adenosine-specific RNA methylase IME4